MNAPEGRARVELAAGDGRLLVAPAAGGAIARYAWRDIDVLRPAPEDAIRGGRVREMGCYPLVPYSNRIGRGRLEFRGRTLSLRPNFPPEPHAIHGVGWQRPWTVRDQGPSSATIELRHLPDDDWPFAFEAEQEFTLSPAALEARIALRNAGDEPMPAGLGFHPYFPGRSGARLQARWSGVWTSGPDRLPATHARVPPEWDFAAPRPVGPWVVDHCFTGWERRAVLEYADHRVVLTASEALDRLVCFCPGDGRDFIALEPVSHVIDAFALAASGRGDTGMRVLAPGEAFSASMTIAVQAP